MKNNNSFFSNKLYILIVLFIFALGLGIRLVNLTNLPLDFHPTRQLFSALKARGMYYQLSPEINNWQREMAISQWKTLATIEPPIVEKLTVLGYRVAGRADLVIPRVYSILFWMFGGIFVFLAVRRLISPDGALLSLAFYLFLPYGVFASRSFQPDPLMIALIAGFIWAVSAWDEEQTWGWAILAGLFGGLAILVKTVAVFFVAGGALGIVFGGMGLRKAWKNIQIWSIALLSIMPTAIYFFYGVVMSGDLAQQFSGRFFPEMLLSPFFYLRWELKLNEVIGHLSIVLSFLGLLLFRQKKQSLIIGLWLGYIVYGMVFAYHFSTHDYYQLPFILVAAISLASLGDIFSKIFVERWGNSLSRQLVVGGLLLFAVVATSWSVRAELRAVDFRPQADTYAEIGNLLRPEGGVISLSDDYGYRLAYWGWLRTMHWPSLGDLGYQQKRGKSQTFAQVFESNTNGRSFFLVTDMAEWELQTELQAHLVERYPLFAEGDGYLVFDLRQ